MSRKISVIVLSLVSIFVLSFGFNSNVYADDFEIPKYTYYDDISQTRYDFFDKETYDDVISSLHLRIPGPWKRTVVDSQFISKKFMGYHYLTPEWSKSSHYHVQGSTTISATSSVGWKYGSVAISANRTEGITRVIPADASRYSRLGFSADLLLERVKVSNPTGYGHYFNMAKVVNTYIDVIYK